VAHRGATGTAPENTLAAFWRAFELGADAVELDVRLSRDAVPVVYHYAYLDAATTGHGPIWERSLAELRELRVGGPEGACIPTLSEVLEALAGRLVLEIELKGPEPETVEVVGRLLDGFRPAWEALEVTSYEALLLKAFRQRCPGVRTALLVPRSEPSVGWMPRARWEALVRGEGCPLCAELASTEAENAHGFWVADLSLSRLQLAREQHVPGWCVLICRRHVREPHELPAAEQRAFFDDLVRVGEALERVYAAAKMNYQLLGNLVPHLHAHIRPRVYGDPYPGQPVPGPPREPVHLSPTEYRQRGGAIRAALSLV
jgi:glycerophosphoryl diester phosphodiesterase